MALGGWTVGGTTAVWEWAALKAVRKIVRSGVGFIDFEGITRSNGGRLVGSGGGLAGFDFLECPDDADADKAVVTPIAPA